MATVSLQYQIKTVDKMKWKDLKNQIENMSAEAQDQEVLVWDEDGNLFTPYRTVKAYENVYVSEYLGTAVNESDIQEASDQGLELGNLEVLVKKGEHYLIIK